MRRIIYVLIFLLSCASGKATHNRAGQILYRHVSGYTYEFTITTFTYTLSIADRPWLDVVWGDNSVSQVYRTPRERVNVEVLPDNYQRNIYVTTHTFPGSGVYTVIVEDPNRNFGVENIPNSVNTLFSVKTTLRIDPNMVHNNSPELLVFPVDKAALGQRFVHNPSAYDVDGDSLSYELGVCTRGNGTAIENYSLPEFSKELYVDSVTGDFVWDAPTKAGIYNIAMNIIEWRRGIKIGTIARDMQVQVIDSENRPPVFTPLRDTCVLAGTLLNIPVHVTDPDGDDIVLTYSGGPLQLTESAAAVTADGSGAGYASAVFTWQTVNSHVRRQRYTVTFKAEDQNAEVKLVSFASYSITVIAPEVEIMPAVAERKEILLEWQPSVCSHASGYEIYRSTNSITFDPDPCATGIPPGTDYELVTTLDGRDNTLYRDNNNNSGLSPGIEYYYRIVAIFPDGAKSRPSAETSASLLAGTPPVIRADVTKIDNVSGEIRVEWLEKPVMDRIAGKPGPFEYRLFHSVDMNGGWTQLGNPKSMGDTVHMHGGIDTKTTYPHYYRVELWDTGTGTIVDEETEMASSLYPVLRPSDKSVIITFGRYTPWVNTTYEIYRCSSAAGEDTVWVGRTNRETYTDNIDIRNGKEYCYRIKSRGFRNIDGIEYKNENMSHIACTTPLDNVPPCPPELSGKSICNENRNLLEWAYKPECMHDVEKFRIYFSPDPAIHTYTVIDSVAGRDLTYLHNGTLKGCYYVTAVDSTGNQSVESNAVCFDECGGYELPNVFTPNGDNINDVFRSYNPGGVTKVDMRIYNRTGKMVFKTSDPDINWDGRDIDSKRFVSSGVYYYTCDIYEDRFTGEKIVPVSGFVHVYYREGAKPYAPPLD